MEEQLGNELARAFFGSDSVLRRKAGAMSPAPGRARGDARRRYPDGTLTAAMRMQLLSGRIR